jgi:hypothetical protein
VKIRDHNLEVDFKLPNSPPIRSNGPYNTHATERALLTTTQMILEGSAQTLMEVDIKSTHLLKCWAINRGVHFNLPRRSHLPTS